MVHISELDTHRVASVEDIVNVGDEIEVKVISKDNAGRIKLSRKALLSGGDSNDTYEEAEEIDVEIGDIITGKVVNIASFGAFVELSLIHI